MSGVGFGYGGFQDYYSTSKKKQLGTDGVRYESGVVVVAPKQCSLQALYVSLSPDLAPGSYIVEVYDLAGSSNISDSNAPAYVNSTNFDVRKVSPLMSGPPAQWTWEPPVMSEEHFECKGVREIIKHGPYFQRGIIARLIDASTALLVPGTNVMRVEAEFSYFSQKSPNSL